MVILSSPMMKAFKVIFWLYIYWAMPRGLQDISSLTRGFEPGPVQCKCEVLTSGSPRNCHG